MTTMPARVQQVGEMPVTVVAPEEPDKGGVVVLHDGGGAGPVFEDVARRFAGDGYMAVVPHLYHRSGVSFVDTGRAHDSEYLREALTPQGLLADLDASFELLEGRGFSASQVAAVGFCMGGSVAFFAAANRTFGAAVTFYGAGITHAHHGMPPQVDVAGDLQTPWLGLYGDMDPAIPPEDVEVLRVRASDALVPTEVIRYADAGHAFLRPTPDRYRPEAAQDGWRRTCEWLDRYLHPPAR